MDPKDIDVYPNEKDECFMVFYKHYNLIKGTWSC